MLDANEKKLSYNNKNIHTLWQSWPYGKKPKPLKEQNDVNDNDIVVVATVGVIVGAIVVDAVAIVVDAVAKVVDAVVEAALVNVEVLVTQTTFEAQSFTWLIIKNKA